ncbi:MAG: hypothetical protein QME68_07265, partial [Elusimicrobiota bacterium]|nr:hypothetical protein [Elusimicrobiota bacterium]
PKLQSAKIDPLSSRLIRVLSDDVYNIEIRDINQQKILPPTLLQVKLTFKYKDTDSDGYYDYTFIPVERIRVAQLNEDAEKMAISILKARDKHNKQNSFDCNK